jgi:hypothetical protein
MIQGRLSNVYKFIMIKIKLHITQVAVAQLIIKTILLENINFETMKARKIKTFKK